MATNKDKVEIFIPKTSDNDDPNLFVSVNFKNYLLPKGKTSLVPPEVAAEVIRSQKAQGRLSETESKLQELAKKEING